MPSIRVSDMPTVRPSDASAVRRTARRPPGHTDQTTHLVRRAIPQSSPRWSANELRRLVELAGVYTKVDIFSPSRPTVSFPPQRLRGNGRLPPMLTTHRLAPWTGGVPAATGTETPNWHLLTHRNRSLVVYDVEYTFCWASEHRRLGDYSCVRCHKRRTSAATIKSSLYQTVDPLAGAAEYLSTTDEKVPTGRPRASRLRSHLRLFH
jgi:hypothetical protein